MNKNNFTSKGYIMNKKMINGKTINDMSFGYKLDNLDNEIEMMYKRNNNPIQYYKGDANEILNYLIKNKEETIPLEERLLSLTKSNKSKKTKKSNKSKKSKKSKKSNKSKKTKKSNKTKKSKK